MSSKPKNLDSFFSTKCALASFIANYIVSIFHPLQLLKTRQQSHDGKIVDNIVPQYRNITNGLSGLFKGVHLSTFSAAIANSLFFWIYEKRKLYYEQLDNRLIDATLWASTESGIITTVITQPFWVIKTRMLLNTECTRTEIENIVGSAKEIIKQHGFRGLYLGISINLLLTTTGIVQMLTYQQSKIFYNYLIGSSFLQQKYFICGSISKLISTVITYPLTTIRTRVQQNQYVKNDLEKKYHGTWDVCYRIVKDEGFKGFFKGLKANLIRSIPHRGVYFYFYQLFKSLFINQPKQL